MWEGVGDRTELQYIDPHSYGHQRCVFLILQCCSTGGPGAQLSVESWLSLPHLVSNSSDLQLTRGSWGPLLLGGGFPYHILSPTRLNSNSSDLQLTDFLSLPSYIIVQSPTQSLEWHVWSSSSGNNSHAVARSPSSGASVCTVEF